MKLQLFIVFVKDAEGNPRAGVLLAEDQKDAFTKAVGNCKSSFGPASRVTFIKHLGQADLPTMFRSQAYRILSEYDQVVFAAVQLDELTTKTVELMESLHSYVMAMKEEIERQQAKENKE